MVCGYVEFLFFAVDYEVHRSFLLVKYGFIPVFPDGLVSLGVE